MHTHKECRFGPITYKYNDVQEGWQSIFTCLEHTRNLHEKNSVTSNDALRITFSSRVLLVFGPMPTFHLLNSSLCLFKRLTIFLHMFCDKCTNGLMLLHSQPRINLFHKMCGDFITPFLRVFWQCPMHWWITFNPCHQFRTKFNHFIKCCIVIMTWTSISYAIKKT